MEQGQRHHALFPRKLHDANSDTKWLRQKHNLIPRLVTIGHAALHSEVVIVPPLDRFTAGRVARDFMPVHNDTIGSIEMLMRSIEHAIRHPKVQELERMNAAVTLHALELQIPFIREYEIKPFS